jgi:hypothetical protein
VSECNEQIRGVHGESSDRLIVRRILVKNRTRSRTAPAQPASPQDVESFLDALRHPLKDAIVLLREVIRGAAPGISESIKWNAPSFHTSEHFATFHLRATDSVQVVLHRGAKPRADGGIRGSIADPTALLRWRDQNRAIVRFRDLADVQATRRALTTIVHQWLKFV